MKTLFFLDIDGTIADASHRMGLAPPKNQKRGDASYEQWLEDIQQPQDMLKDTPIKGTRDLLNQLNSDNTVYLTSRHEKYRDVTKQWLSHHGYPNLKLIMRPEKDYRPSCDFKSDLISRTIKERYLETDEYPSVVVIDDDQTGKLKDLCVENGWCFFKAQSGGKAY